MKRTRYYFTGFIFSVVFILTILWLMKDDTAVKKQETENKQGYSITRQIRYSYTLQNKTNQVIRNAEFKTYGPVKQTATQLCKHIETSHPYELIADEYGNQVIHFIINEFPPYATKIIKIKADLLMADTALSMSRNKNQHFLAPEKYIESGHKLIAEKAQKLKSPVNIFEWVSKNIKYEGYIKNPRGAFYAFTKRSGDCTEFMYLFTAMCRSVGIPARGIGGYICTKDTILKPSAYHNWAEFYDNGVWHISDPQNRVIMSNSEDYIAMRIIRNSDEESGKQFQRFWFKGEGLKVKMNL